MISSARSTIRAKIGSLWESKDDAWKGVLTAFLSDVLMIVCQNSYDTLRWDSMCSQASMAVVRTIQQANRLWSSCYAHVGTGYQGAHQDGGSSTKNEGSVGLIRMIVSTLWLSDGRLRKFGNPNLGRGEEGGIIVIRVQSNLRLAR